MFLTTLYPHISKHSMDGATLLTHTIIQSGFVLSGKNDFTLNNTVNAWDLKQLKCNHLHRFS